MNKEMKFSITFTDIKGISNFVNLCGSFDCNVLASVKDFRVNAKSLLGMVYICTEGDVKITVSGKDAICFVNAVKDASIVSCFDIV